MTLEWRRQLEEAGVDVASALERMMGSEALLERLLGKFLEDPQYPALCGAMKGGDAARAVIAAHTLKGVCGNLSMNGLYGLFTELVDALRAEDLPLADRLMEQIEPAYNRVAAAIREHAEDGRA